MQIILLRDLNPAKGLVRGAIRDWPRPVITEMSQQIGDKDWYSYDAGIIRSLGRTSAREQLRPEPAPALEVPQAPVLEPQIVEPTSTAEAILGDQGAPHRAAMADVPRAQRGPGRPPRAQRGPGRPPKNPVLEPA